MDESIRRKLRWLIAILDGFWALGFLLLGYLALDFPLRLFISEWDKLNLDFVAPPALTVLLDNIVPESGWALFMGTLFLAVAYGRLSLLTQDPITNRLFRWSVALLMFMFFSICLPLFDLLIPLPRPRESIFSLDEVAFIALSLLLAALAFTKRAVDKDDSSQ